MSIYIIALRNRNNKIDEVVFELLTKAKEMTKGEINVILPIGLCEYSSFTDELTQYGADNIYIVQNSVLENYSASFYTYAICEILKKAAPNIVLLGANANGRDLAPHIAARLNTGLTADCTELSIDENGKLNAIRPTFGGSLLACILSRTTPQMATVRSGVFKKEKNNTDKKSTIKVVDINFDNVVSKIEELDFIPKTQENSTIIDADIILAGGMGLKTKENFEKLYILADLIGAKVAATRLAVEAGWANCDIQIGQTGKTVFPKVYVAFGISGALQHIEGIKGAKKIISINSDTNAPIIKVSDRYIIGDATTVINKLINEAKKYE